MGLGKLALFMRPLKTKHLNNFLVKIFVSCVVGWGGGRGVAGDDQSAHECGVQ